jgi:hypothetical protein
MSYRAALFFVLLGTMFLVSCTSLHNWAFGGPEDDAKAAAKEKSAQQGLKEGDRKTAGGVEYIYTRNNKYMTNPYEPEFTWVKKDEYLQSRDDAMRERLVAERKERDELRKRLAKLEQEVADGAPPPETTQALETSGPPGQPQPRRWEVYGMSATGVNLLIDKGSITRTGNLLQFWRRRTFTEGSYQKEIISREEVDCRRKKYRTLEIEGIYWDGRHDKSKTATSWVNFYDNTTEDLLFSDTCKDSGLGGTRS